MVRRWNEKASLAGPFLPSGSRRYNGTMTRTAQEIYQTQVVLLPFAERLRLAALPLDEFKALPSLTPSRTETPRPRPKRGSGKNDISYMAEDFNAPLEEMREYSE